jgi:hypothetical protein
MPATPPKPEPLDLEEPEILEPDPDEPDLVPEERTVSQTRRLGSHAQANLELLDGAPAKPILDDPTTAADKEPEAIPAAAAAVAPAPAAAQVEVRPYSKGDVIAGKYRLRKIIGRGGMGAVWQAHNLPLDVDVALKLIRRDRTAPEAAGRLLQEGRAAARLKHPSIVRVFDFGETERGDPFIVMELLRGESLAAILRRKKRLTPAVAVQTLLPVASALVSAHQNSIVHRDLKPDNVLIVTDETGALVPKVVDFGIAKLLSNDIDRQVTMAGEVLGSPDYMSPEQARGAENVGEATDVWAFSVVLYETLAGKRPFDGPNYNALIASILTLDPERIPSAHADDDLWAIVRRGLAKSVDQRWHQMKDLGAALALWAVERGLEEDVTGASIARQWLPRSATKRLITVMPEVDEPTIPMHAPLPAAGAPAIPRPLPAAGAPAIPPPMGAPLPPPGPVSIPTIPPMGSAAGGRGSVRWIVGGAALAMVVMAAAAYLARDRLLLLAAAPAAASATASATATAVAPPPPSATASATASAEPSAAEAPSGSPSGSAAPSASGSAKAPVRPWKKPRAPQVPKNIKF